MIWTPEVIDAGTGEQLPYTAWLEGQMIVSDWGGTPIELPNDYQSRGVEIRCIGYKNAVAQIGITTEVYMELDNNDLGVVEVFGQKKKNIGLFALIILILLYLSKKL